MVDLKKLREVLVECKQTIPEINSVKWVSSDDRLTDKLENHKKTDNTLLMCVTPAFGGFKQDSDNGGYRSYLQFFILNKIDYKTTEPEDVQVELQPIVQAFIGSLANSNTDGCPTFRNLDWASISILPITNKASCCGWEVQITDKTYTGIHGRTE